MVRVSSINTRVSIIVYGWRNAHYSIKRVSTIGTPVILNKKKRLRYILAHPHVCVFDSMHMAGWHSTTLESAKNSKASLTPGKCLATPTALYNTSTPITYTRRSSHILHGQGPHNIYETPTPWSAIRDLVRQSDSITAAEPVAHRAVRNRIEHCCTFKNGLW